MTNSASRLPGSSEPAAPSTSTPPELKSGAAWLASATPEEVDEFLAGLSENALLALPWMFEFWALPHQLPPEGAWKTWVIMGGRGAGKTRAGAEWVRAEVEGARPLDPGRCAAGGAGGRDGRPGARGDGVRRERDPGLLAARPAAGVGGGAQAAGLAERRGGAGVFGA